MSYMRWLFYTGNDNTNKHAGEKVGKELENW